MAKLKKYTNIDMSAEAAGNQYYTGEVPPAGVYIVKVKSIKVKQNRNGDDMLSILSEIAEPKDSKRAGFNTYGIWNNINVTDSCVPYLKQFFSAIGADAQDFIDGNGLSDDKVDPPALLKVGKVKIGDNLAKVSTKREEYLGVEKLSVTSWAPIAAGDVDADADDDDDIIDEEDIDEEDIDEEDSDDDAEDDEEESDEDTDEESEEGYTREELEELSLAELKAIAKDNEWTTAELRGMSADDIISALLGEEDDEADEDDVDDDEAPF